MNKHKARKHIDADKLIEDFKVSGRFDCSELGEIIAIIEDQPAIAEARDV